MIDAKPSGICTSTRGLAIREHALLTRARERPNRFPAKTNFGFFESSPSVPVPCAAIVVGRHIFLFAAPFPKAFFAAETGLDTIRQNPVSRCKIMYFLRNECSGFRLRKG